MANLSIIIISYNTRDITKKCLETIAASLNHAKFTTEIIVIDNASTDGSTEMLEAFQKLPIFNDQFSIKITKAGENLGFSKANNLAVKQAEGEVILFLNSDIEVLDDAVPTLYQYFTSADNRFQFVGGKLYEKDGKTPQASCGPAFTLPVIFTFLFLRGDYLKITRYSPDSIKQIDWVSGACIMCLKSDFEKIGGFDENIFMYMEEIDLLHRAKKADMRVGFYPDAHFIHLGSASSGNRKNPILNVFKGYLYFYKKHYTPYQYAILKGMLQLKAQISLAIGRITSNTYLIETYGEAQTIIKNA